MPANASTMTTTSSASSTQFSIDDLAGIRGKIIIRSDPEYDAARAVYNGAVDRYPLAIVRCVDVADVIACVTYARDNVLPLAIRGGGHHGGGFGVWDDALVVDLSGLRSTSVDPVAGTVRVDGGCVWVMLIMPLERSGWRYRRASSLRRGLAG